MQSVSLDAGAILLEKHKYSFRADQFDQDTGNMGWMQEGMVAARKKTAIFANDQEVRIRHIHQILDKYLGIEGTALAAS